MKLNNILAGMIGALFIALVLIWITVWLKPFNYQAVYIANPKAVIADSVNTETLTCNQISVLKDLENKGILLTPQEYTSNISSYYSTLVAFLIGLFILFSFVSFFSIRNNAQKDIEEIRTKLKESFDEAKEKIEKELANDLIKSKPFNESIINDILGRIEDDLLTKDDKEQINKNIDDITHKQIDLEENVNLLFDIVDSKSEIKE